MSVNCCFEIPQLYTDISDRFKRFISVALMKAYPIAMRREHKIPEARLYCHYEYNCKVLKVRKALKE